MIFARFFQGIESLTSCLGRRFYAVDVNFKPPRGYDGIAVLP